jgi:hypothetical protein
VPPVVPKLDATDGVNFMKGVKFSILGYTADKRITGLIRFLTSHGGAIYKEKLEPGDVDLIVVRRFKGKMMYHRLTLISFINWWKSQS